eukprot:Plantae.Rhodophyta-Rhodochaete_pulchella.ctg528.p1 GENE.Plantae.Rhodophyta-Rhodochaete_pulchella.ctg528~~Plantae.Rhodophyta-Rhodochaete_pulchella.ctg528.p1  ORF type:complete len:255 (-),score=51.41 Plantae.Rhodophyta-Rhodochaete_pulchella.ctg528:1153-1917(-)
MAFINNVLLGSRRSPLQYASAQSRPRVAGSARRARTAVACATTPDDKQAVKPKLSKSEEMALLLGRDLNDEKKKSKEFAEKMKSSTNLEMLRDRVLAVLAVVVGVGSHFLEKAHPLSGSFLLHKMEDQSVSLAEATSNGKPSVVEFFADWCDNCKEMAGGMNDIENEYARLVNFVVMDSEKDANAQALEDFAVDGLPHISLLDARGEVQTTFIGYTPRSIIDDDLEALTSGKPLPHKGFDLTDMLRVRNDNSDY